MQHGLVVVGIFLPSDKDRTLPVYTPEGLLDHPSSRLATARTSGNFDLLIFLLWNMGTVPPSTGGGSRFPIAIVLIAKKILVNLLWTGPMNDDGVERFRQEIEVSNVSGRDHDG